MAYCMKRSLYNLWLREHSHCKVQLKNKNRLVLYSGSPVTDLSKTEAECDNLLKSFLILSFWGCLDFRTFLTP